MMTIDWTHAWLGEVPALIARPRAAIGPLPTVLWFHGWSADKEVHRSELAQLAGAGLLAVGIDSVGHGERQPPELAQHLARSAREAQPLFDSLVAETVDEVPMLVDRLIDRGGADAERIGAAGVSMGACIVYGAIARERRLRAAVALLGSPARGRPDGSRLAVDRFFPSALLSVTAGADVVVPPAAAASLHAELTDWYRNDPDRLCHQSFPDAEQPGAKKSEIAGLHGVALKILLAAPPVDGKANEALMKFVAGTLGIAKSEVTQKRPGLDHHSGQG